MIRIRVRVLLALAGGIAAVFAGALLLIVVLGLGSHPAGATTPPPSASGEFTPITAARLVDTVQGVGAPKGKLGPRQTIVVQITGRGGIPSGATAITATLTARTGTASSRLTAYPAGTPRSAATTLYFGAGQSVAGNVTVGLSSGGTLAVFNAAGSVTVDLDVQGYYAPSGKVVELQTEVSTLSDRLDTLQTSSPRTTPRSPPCRRLRPRTTPRSPPCRRLRPRTRPASTH